MGGADAFLLPQLRLAAGFPARLPGRQVRARPPGTGPGPVPGSAPPTTDFLHGMSERTASVLCYIPVFGIIPAIIFLASQKFRRNARVRFDAFQSLYVFVAWLILHAVVPVVFMGFGPAETAMALRR